LATYASALLIVAGSLAVGRALTRALGSPGDELGRARGGI